MMTLKGGIGFSYTKTWLGSAAMDDDIFIDRVLDRDRREADLDLLRRVRDRLRLERFDRASDLSSDISS